jgi:hypothetical protein
MRPRIPRPIELDRRARPGQLPPRRLPPGPVARPNLGRPILPTCTHSPPPMEVVNGLRNPKLDRFLPRRKRATSPDVRGLGDGGRVGLNTGERR